MLGILSATLLVQSYGLNPVTDASVLGEVSGRPSCRRHHGPYSGKLATLS
jgi:hypothetical protein